jgi:hypothetical protein
MDTLEEMDWIVPYLTGGAMEGRGGVYNGKLKCEEAYLSRPFG